MVQGGKLHLGHVFRQGAILMYMEECTHALRDFIPLVDVWTVLYV